MSPDIRCQNPAYSPDGKFIAYMAMDRPGRALSDFRTFALSEFRFVGFRSLRFLEYPRGIVQALTFALLSDVFLRLLGLESDKNHLNVYNR